MFILLVPNEEKKAERFDCYDGLQIPIAVHTVVLLI